MRILAVIPACEGSVKLPNKNMRVINGKPMIYYVINNARKSKYVTDIIVTTNSSEIISLAKQMKVMTRLRDAALCNQETSIDAVVYDVFQELNLDDYDYVVTMQSISPMLKVETLDKAFEECFVHHWDTLISVKNQPQFYWTKQNGVPCPQQDKRINRHLLPPFYIETGAFLITKSQFIKEDNRIGKNVELFELDGDEAIDINDFGDLYQAENAMSCKATAMYVNGNSNIGLGHISRVMQIADEFFIKPDIYYDIDQTDPSVFGEIKYNLIPVKGTEGMVEQLKTTPYGVVINDVLNTTKEYMMELRRCASNAILINFEDEGDGARYADVVINALYEDSNQANVKVGSKYYILPKQFLIYEPIEIAETVSNVIVSFGGADPQGYTERVMEIVTNSKYSHINFYVVLGKAKHNAKVLMRYNEQPNIMVMHDVDNMPEIMNKCDIAISSRGRTCFELAALGIPTLSIAQHAREEMHRFICEENGFLCLPTAPDAIQLEDCLDKLLMSDKQMRQHLQKLMLNHDLRNGRKNVTALIHTIK